MILWSALLTLVAVALLIAGILTSNLAVMIGALAASVLAGLFLLAAVRQRRASLPAASVLPAEVTAPEVSSPFPPMAPVAPIAPAGEDVPGRRD